MAMILFPDAMKKAQTELDAIIGVEHYPEFKDESSLPYVEALIKEVFR